MCGGCGGRSAAVRVVRNVPKTRLKTANGVIVVRQGVGKKAKPKRFKPSSIPTGGVRVARSGR